METLSLDESQKKKVQKVIGETPIFRALKPELIPQLLKVAEAVRDMAWRRHQEGRLTTRGKRMYEEGMSLLAGEIAASRGIEVTDAEEQVRERLQESFQPEPVLA